MAKRASLQTGDTYSHPLSPTLNQMVGQGPPGAPTIPSPSLPSQRRPPPEPGEKHPTQPTKNQKNSSFLIILHPGRSKHSPSLYPLVLRLRDSPSTNAPAESPAHHLKTPTNPTTFTLKPLSQLNPAGRIHFYLSAGPATAGKAHPNRSKPISLSACPAHALADPATAGKAHPAGSNHPFLHPPTFPKNTPPSETTPKFPTPISCHSTPSPPGNRLTTTPQKSRNHPIPKHLGKNFPMTPSPPCAKLTAHAYAKKKCVLASSPGSGD